MFVNFAATSGLTSLVGVEYFASTNHGDIHEFGAASASPEKDLTNFPVSSGEGFDVVLSYNISGDRRSRATLVNQSPHRVIPISHFEMNPGYGRQADAMGLVDRRPAN